MHLSFLGQLVSGRSRTHDTRVRGSLSHDSGVSVSVSHGQDGTQHFRVTLVREAGPFTTALLLPLYIINAPLSPAQAPEERDLAFTPGGRKPGLAVAR